MIRQANSGIIRPEEIYLFQPASRSDSESALTFIKQIRAVRHRCQEQSIELPLFLNYCLKNEIAFSWYDTLSENEKDEMDQSDHKWISALKRDFMRSPTQFSAKAHSTRYAKIERVHSIWFKNEITSAAYLQELTKSHQWWTSVEQPLRTRQPPQTPQTPQPSQLPQIKQIPQLPQISQISQIKQAPQSKQTEINLQVIRQPTNGLVSRAAANSVMSASYVGQIPLRLNYAGKSDFVSTCSLSEVPNRVISATQTSLTYFNEKSTPHTVKRGTILGKASSVDRGALTYSKQATGIAVWRHPSRIKEIPQLKQSPPAEQAPQLKQSSSAKQSSSVEQLSVEQPSVEQPSVEQLSVEQPSMKQLSQQSLQISHLEQKVSVEQPSVEQSSLILQPSIEQLPFVEKSQLPHYILHTLCITHYYLDNHLNHWYFDTGWGKLALNEPHTTRCLRSQRR